MNRQGAKAPDSLSTLKVDSCKDSTASLRTHSTHSLYALTVRRLSVKPYLESLNGDSAPLIIDGDPEADRAGVIGG